MKLPEKLLYSLKRSEKYLSDLSRFFESQIPDFASIQILNPGQDNNNKKIGDSKEIKSGQFRTLKKPPINFFLQKFFNLSLFDPEA